MVPPFIILSNSAINPPAQLSRSCHLEHSVTCTAEIVKGKTERRSPFKLGWKDKGFERRHLWKNCRWKDGTKPSRHSFTFAHFAEGLAPFVLPEHSHQPLTCTQPGATMLRRALVQMPRIFLVATSLIPAYRD